MLNCSSQEQAGYLVKRERERLETELDNFFVIERDGSLIGCAALYPLNETVAEVAGGQYIPITMAIWVIIGCNVWNATLLTRHLVWPLTTVAAYWFQEQGFMPAQVSDLPDARQALYNYQRLKSTINRG